MLNNGKVAAPAGDDSDPPPPVLIWRDEGVVLLADGKHQVCVRAEEWDRAKIEIGKGADSYTFRTEEGAPCLLLQVRGSGPGRRVCYRLLASDPG